MELIRISERKLKIMLTPTDMCHFELDTDSFGEDSQQMHHAFRLLLREIRKQTDFEGDDRQIAVQYFPSRKGGCEMFISYTPEQGKRASEDCTTAKENRSLLPSPAPRTTGFHRDCAYRFERIEHLLSACRRLIQTGYIGESCAFRDDQGRYFLLISFLSSSPFSIPEEWSFLNEYGTLENAAWLRLYISEHGKAVCPVTAVEILSKLA